MMHIDRRDSLSLSQIHLSRLREFFWGNITGPPFSVIHEPRSAGLMEEILKDYYKWTLTSYKKGYNSTYRGYTYRYNWWDPTLYTAWNLECEDYFPFGARHVSFGYFLKEKNDILLMEDIIKPVDMQNIGLAVLCDRFLVGGFNPFEKYAPQIGSFPQVGTWPEIKGES